VAWDTTGQPGGICFIIDFYQTSGGNRNTFCLVSVSTCEDLVGVKPNVVFFDNEFSSEGSALDCLDYAAGHAMSAVLNIAFAGQYKELGRLYEQGQILQVEPEMFEDMGDVNIDLILTLIVNIV
jgi:hypothetical protein